MIDGVSKLIAEEGNAVRLKSLQDRKLALQQSSEISTTCMLYCITLYYTLKETFSDGTEGLFDYYKFYNNRTYKDEIIKYFSEGFLSETVQVIIQSLRDSNKTNVGNWVRAKSSQESFKEILNNKLAIESIKLEAMYKDFAEKFMSIPIEG